MTRRGVFSFIHYLLYLLIGLVAYHYSGTKIDQLIDQTNPAHATVFLILFILLLFGLVLLCYGIAGVVIKGLHMLIGGWLPGILCILLDAVAVWFWFNVMETWAYVGSLSAEAVPFLIPIALALLSAISNVLSLRRIGT